MVSSQKHANSSHFWGKKLWKVSLKSNNMFNYNILRPLAQKTMVTTLNDISGAQQRNFSQYIL